MKVHSTLLAVIVAGLLLLAGCPPKQTGNTVGNGQTGTSGKTGAVATAAVELTIGSIQPLTGPAAAFGTFNRRGQELAVKHLAESGQKVNLMFEDSMSDPKSAVAAYQKLRSANVNVMSTGMSGVCMALVPLAKDDGVLLFADAAHPAITGQSPLVFRHSQTANQEAELLSKYIKDKLAVDKAGLLWVNDDYGAAFKKAYEGLSTLACETSFEKTDADLRNVVTKLLGAKPAAVIICGYGKPVGLAVKRLREAGFKGSILVDIAWAASPDTAASAGDAGKNVIYVDFQMNVTDPGYLKLKQDYQASYSEPIPAFVVLEYNTIKLMAFAALSTNSTDPSSMADFLRKAGSYQSAGEMMTITASGDVLPALELKVQQ